MFYFQQETLKLSFGSYSGDVKDGKPNGHGSVVFNNDDIQERKTFEGTWVNGKRDGPGRMVWQNGEEFTGDWKNNLQQVSEKLTLKPN